MKNLTLKTKLIFSLLLAGLVPMLSIGIYSYYQSSESLHQQAIEKISAVRDVKGSAIKRYFETIKSQIITFSDNVMIQDAMSEFSQAFYNFNSENNFSKGDIKRFKSHLKKFYHNEFGKKYTGENGPGADFNSYLNGLSDTEIALQYFYISSNPNPLGGKEALDYARDNSTYSKLHAKYHPSIRHFLQDFGYYDIFLIDNKTGNIVYSVFKELDYGTSLKTGPYSKTNFAEAFKKAQGLSKPNEYVIVDFKKYTPSYESPASFIATPVWKGRKKIGTVIFQMPIDKINMIMNERSGMGETGETYLIGSDLLMRSDSFLDKENHNVVSSFKKPEKGKIETYASEEIFKGNQGSHTNTNYLGSRVFSAYTPIEILGMNWGLIAEISAEEALAPVQSLKTANYIIFAIASIGIFAFAFYLADGLAKKISKIASYLLKSAKELGHSSEEISSSSTSLSESATEQSASLQETVSSIDEISSMVQKNADAANSSTQVSQKSNEAAMRGKKTVESMIESIDEIATSNKEIMREMHNNNDQLSHIVNVISEIGEKTKVINDIVFQTKLLSFNASVEAARAGEHGKGFAVVAEEVGNLASMSGKAALEITEMLDKSIKQVKDIVDTTKGKIDGLVSTGKEKIEKGTTTAQECGDALDEILQNVSSVNEMVQEIAEASKEQSSGVSEVNVAMRQLDQSNLKNTKVAQESSVISKTLKEQATHLNVYVKNLMSVVQGDNCKNSSLEENTDHNPKQNVINLEDKRSENKEKSIEVKQESFSSKANVSGSDVVPSADDPRFEDL